MQHVGPELKKSEPIAGDSAVTDPMPHIQIEASAVPKLGMVQARQLLDYDLVALVLQGGGALGAYQGGVFEALCEAGIEPRWFSGVSIGAINGAIMAGNPPGQRLDRLRDF